MVSDGLQRLEQDTRALAQAAGWDICIGFDDCPPLSAECPACTQPLDRQWQLRIWRHLPADEQGEALAHELGHILVYHQGLSRLQDTVDEVAYDLGKGLVNFVGHRLLIDILQTVYSIRSASHLQLYRGILEPQEEVYDASEEHVIRVIQGLRLWDLARTAPDCAAQAEACALQHDDSKGAFDAAKRYLDDITPEMAPNVMRARVQLFAQATGCCLPRQGSFIAGPG